MLVLLKYSYNTTQVETFDSQLRIYIIEMQIMSMSFFFINAIIVRTSLLKEDGFTDMENDITFMES